MTIVKQENTFEYFSMFGSVTGRILDFGSNSGNLLRSSDSQILESEYTGVDISVPAIVKADDTFPRANWIVYDRYHPCYNPTGRRDAWPVLRPRTYDKCFSYSVFTHFTLQETLDVLNFLRDQVNTHIYFSFCDLHCERTIDWFVNKRGPQCERPSADADVQYMVDDKIMNESDIPKRCDHLVSFFDPDFLVGAINEQGLRCEVKKPPADSPWTHSCAMILV